MQYVREVLCFTWYVLISLLGVIVRLPHAKKNTNKQIILLVSGLGAQPLIFIFLRKYFEKRNFAIYIFQTNLLKTLGFGVKDISELAVELDRYIQANDLNNFVLVGMSAGALVSLIYLEKYNGWKRVKRFLTLSAAFKGGWLAYLFSFIQVGSKMRPGGSLIQEISHMRLTHPEKMVCLYGKWDELVVPFTSYLPGVQQKQLTEGGHAYLQTFSQKTFAALAHFATL